MHTYKIERVVGTLVILSHRISGEVMGYFPALCLDKSSKMTTFSNSADFVRLARNDSNITEAMIGFCWGYQKAREHAQSHQLDYSAVPASLVDMNVGRPYSKPTEGEEVLVEA